MTDRFYRRFKALAIVLTVTCLIVVGTSHSFRASYHRIVFRNAATMPGWLIGGSSISRRRQIEMSSIHSLVDLGVLRKRHFELKNIKTDTQEGKHLSSVLMGKTGTVSLEAEMWLANFNNPLRPYYITVYCLPNDLPAWEQFISEHDVPDYFQKYGLTSILSSQKQEQPRMASSEAVAGD